MRLRAALPLAAGLMLAATAAAAHEDHRHGAAARAAAAPLPDSAGSPLPYEARFDLVDHRGRAVTARDFRGGYLLVFFGYANCEGICPVALPRMAAALDRLGPEAGRVQPLFVTVDPARDTPAALAEKLPAIHPRLRGLTGTAEALRGARRAFGLRAAPVAEMPDGSPIYSHGSYIYLVGPEGGVLTLLPPVLDAERMAAIVRGYLT